MEEKKYIEEYKKFIADYKSGITTGDIVGEVIARQASYFTDANIVYSKALFAYNLKAAEIEETEDDNGKAISSSKAKVMSAATEESGKLIEAKTDIENIESNINSLKSLQKGLLQEYSYAGLN